MIYKVVLLKITHCLIKRKIGIGLLIIFNLYFELKPYC
jgi:hypothetical protein